MAKWVIYILTNPSFPDYVKIWYAKDIEKRLKDLNRSETIPYAFRAYAIYQTDRALTDKEVHKLIDVLNPDLRAIEEFDGKKRTKEFYAMSAEDAYKLFECIAKISGTENKLKKMKPTWHEVLDAKTAQQVSQSKKAKQFSFYDMWIKDWEEVVYTKDNTIKAIVVADNKVKYWKETMTLTWLASKLLKKNHWIPWPNYFTYKWRKLNDIRGEMGLIKS